jgi:hypothetical protein
MNRSLLQPTCEGLCDNFSGQILRKSIPPNDSAGTDSPQHYGGKDHEVTLALLFPQNGAAFDESEGSSVRISVLVSAGRQTLGVERRGSTLILTRDGAAVGKRLAVLLDGADALDESDGVVTVTHGEGGRIEIAGGRRWRPGFHTVAVLEGPAGPSRSSRDTDSSSALDMGEAVAHFMVVGASADRIPEEFECVSLLAGHGHVGTHVRSAGYSPWARHTQCLRLFTEMFPSCWQAQHLFGQILEALGLWGEAAARYQFAHDAAAACGGTNLSSLAVQAAGMRALDDAERELRRRRCTWERGGVSEAAVTEGEEAGDLYLSVIMVSRHDGTQFCQMPADGCLDRMEASLSTLLLLLARHGVAAETEIILVEWNPCLLSGTGNRISCGPRADGYMSLEELIRTRVEVPAEAAAVRILLVSEEMHNSFYNPHGFDLLEYVGKNIAARRARGRFVLFTNPDDCLSDPMAAFLARKRLRSDAFYTALRSETPTFFQGAYLPPSHLPSAEAMARSVFKFGVVNTLFDHAYAYSRAACEEGGADDAPKLSHRYDYDALHEGATGDFFLIARDALHAIRGYPEIPSNCFVDGTLVYAAVAHGYGQLVLGGACTVFHQWHPRSFNTMGSMLDGGYPLVAQDLLDAGEYANHRVDDVDQPPDTRLLHQWNDALWGRAEAAVPQVVLVGSCAVQ